MQIYEKSNDIINYVTKTVISRISLEIFEQCYSNLAPGMYITKKQDDTIIFLFCVNTLGSSLFLSICNFSLQYHHTLRQTGDEN